MEIKVNDYIRTIDGYIRKVTQVNKKGTYEGICYGAYSVDKPYKNSQGISAKKIKSHSKDIIDLIEEEDIAVLNCYGFKVKKIVKRDDILELKLGNYELLEILTKEQFNQMKYIVGGE